MKHATKILGVRVNTLDKAQVLETIEGFLQSSVDRSLRSDLALGHIVTVNPEFIMAAQDSARFRATLNRAELSVADGVGLLWAATFLSGRKSFGRLIYSLLAIIFYPSFIRQVILEQITGVDLMADICQIAEKKKQKVFLLGGLPKSAERAVSVLKKRFPTLGYFDIRDDTFSLRPLS